MYHIAVEMLEGLCTICTNACWKFWNKYTDTQRACACQTAREIPANKRQISMLTCPSPHHARQLHTQSSPEPRHSSISITLPSLPPSLHSLPPPRHLPTNLKPVPLSPLLSPQILLIDLLPQLRELKRLTPTPLQPLPHAHSPPIRPRQPTNPRLHIPPELQRHIAAVLQLARDIRDLVFGALLLEMQFADRVRGVWVLFCGSEGLL